MEIVMLNTNIYGRPFDDLSQKEIFNEAVSCYKIFLLASNRFIEIKTSDVLFTELSLIKESSKRNLIFHLIKSVGKERIRLNDEVIRMADLIYPEFLNDYMDSLHLAFATISQCNYFISCDKDITAKADEIEKLLIKEDSNTKIRNPIEFLSETEGLL